VQLARLLQLIVRLHVGAPDRALRDAALRGDGGWIGHHDRLERTLRAGADRLTCHGDRGQRNEKQRQCRGHQDRAAQHHGPRHLGIIWG